MKFRLYYADRLVDSAEMEIRGQLFDWLKTMRNQHGDEIFQGGILRTDPPLDGRPWYRCDITPLLLEEVPKGTRTLDLLLA